MLYAAWKETARSHGEELALIDLGSGRQWSFRQLAEEAENLPAPEPIIFPSGQGHEFIFEVLRAWHHGRTVCPLDGGQQPPSLEKWPDGCVHFKTTSGSLGAPQIIAFTGAQLQADAANITAAMGLRSDWPNLGVISLAHSYGFSNLVLPLLCHGIPLILLPSRLPEAIRDACARFPHLTLPAVPALWRIWHEAGVLSPAIKLAISAGAPLPLGLEQEIYQRSSVKIHNFYGASECGGICYDASTVPRKTDDYAGQPLPGVELEQDAEGCLIVKSAAVGETYWPNPSPALGRGRFYASDRVEICDRRVFLKGRRGEVIHVAGQKIAPECIEQMILRHPGVRECVVFGVPDPGAVRNEAMVACVAGQEGLQPEALKHFLQQTLPAWQLPRHWHFLATLADPERGKISRAKWRERFLAGQL
jgi:acyl-coenzyme A synthetase/AMP-(fatty) acid ligase